MSDNLFVITGATGNIGKRAALTLLERGAKVRAVGRHAGRLAELVANGAEAAVGSLDDAAFLTEAFRGATAVFAMVPPNFTAPDFRAYQRAIVDSIAAAITGSGVSYVVFLSSFGAHLPSGTGPIAGLHEAELKLNQIEGLNVLHLRPAFFMENHFASIDTIKHMGVNGSPGRADVPVPMIATEDIADVVAAALERRDFAGASSRELHGGGEYTFAETTRILGEAIGKPDLAYVQFPAADAKAAMLGLGMSESIVDDYLEMYEAINTGHLQPAEHRSPTNTTPTTLERFAAVFAAVYNAHSDSAHA